MTTQPEPPARVLVVCTANICRSPMAEALLQAYVERRRQPGDRPVVVSSAGTHARLGDPVAPGMLEIADHWRLDLRSHRSQPIGPPVVAQQDLVLTMEGRHRDAVARLGPGAAQRTFLVHEAAELAQHVDDHGGAGHDRVTRLVRGLQQARARIPVEPEDVPDPYGGPPEGYVTTAWQLADLVERIGQALTVALVR